MSAPKGHSLRGRPGVDLKVIILHSEEIALAGAVPHTLSSVIEPGDSAYIVRQQVRPARGWKDSERVCSCGSCSTEGEARAGQPWESEGEKGGKQVAHRQWRMAQVICMGVELLAQAPRALSSRH